VGDADVLRRAGRAFGPQEAAARERCVVAEAEIALVSRDLNWPVKALGVAHDRSYGTATSRTLRMRVISRCGACS
jgi:hypothetical protein